MMYETSNTLKATGGGAVANSIKNGAKSIFSPEKRSASQRKLSGKKSWSFSNVIQLNTAALQRIESVVEERIPVQTHGNCGLFAIITAMRAMGFSDETLEGLTDAMDDFVENSEETFVGEIFTIDLMLSVINGIRYHGDQVLKAKSLSFSSPDELSLLFDIYKNIPDVTILIGYSKPDEYDKYYRLRGNWLKLNSESASKIEMDEALNKKVEIEQFLPKDAHWGMINKIYEDGFVDITDTIEESIPGEGHGYTTLMSIRKLFNSNESLDDDFDWSGFINSDDSIDYNKMDGSGVNKDVSSVSRYLNIKANQMKERMDLSGRIVVIELTERGKEIIG